MRSSCWRVFRAKSLSTVDSVDGDITTGIIPYRPLRRGLAEKSRPRGTNFIGHDQHWASVFGMDAGSYAAQSNAGVTVTMASPRSNPVIIGAEAGMQVNFYR
jgi:hypothetical protein